MTEEKLKKIMEEKVDFSGRREEMKKEGKVFLVDVHEKYKKYLHIEDTHRIDVVLAVALSNKLEGIPLWLIIVGPSGDMKSVQLNSIIGEEVYVLHNLTSKTLVNGYKDKKKFPDLAPILNGKIVVIPDMAQLLKLPPNEKGELWGQLRDLYDGLAGKVSGQGSQSKYSGLKITLLAGSTPAIDGQILVHQDLGTRELIYRTKGNKNKEKVMEKCFENEEFESKIKKELSQITKEFLEQKEVVRNYIPKETLIRIMGIARYVSIMRASAEFDSYTHDLRNMVYPEEPTRIAKQLKRLYVCLTSLSEDYPEERALEILWEVARSSCFPLRIKLFDFMLNQNTELSTSAIAEKLKIGKSTAKRELGVFWNLGIINCRKEPTSFPDKFIDHWEVNKGHKFIRIYEQSRLKI